MSGKTRPCLLKQILKEMDYPYPSLGEAKRECIKYLVNKELKQKQLKAENKVGGNNTETG